MCGLAFALLFALSAFAQTEVVHSEDFQAYKTPSNPPGWVDTSVGNPKPEASGLYKAWPDPLQGNQGTNVVYGTKQSSGKPEGNNPLWPAFVMKTYQAWAKMSMPSTSRLKPAVR